jgi:hypothetical protein
MRTQRLARFWLSSATLPLLLHPLLRLLRLRLLRLRLHPQLLQLPLHLPLRQLLRAKHT